MVHKIGMLGLIVHDIYLFQNNCRVDNFFRGLSYSLFDLFSVRKLDLSFLSTQAQLNWIFSTFQVELHNGDFSADDEEVLSDGKVAENNGLNEVSEDNGGAEVETEEEDDQQPSVVISKSQEPVDSSTTSPLASIRKRFAGEPFGSTSGGSGQEGVQGGSGQ